MPLTYQFDGNKIIITLRVRAKSMDYLLSNEIFADMSLPETNAPEKISGKNLFRRR